MRSPSSSSSPQIADGGVAKQIIASYMKSIMTPQTLLIDCLIGLSLVAGASQVKVFSNILDLLPCHMLMVF